MAREEGDGHAGSEDAEEEERRRREEEEQMKKDEEVARQLQEEEHLPIIEKKVARPKLQGRHSAKMEDDTSPHGVGRALYWPRHSAEGGTSPQEKAPAKCSPQNGKLLPHIRKNGSLQNGKRAATKSKVVAGGVKKVSGEGESSRSIRGGEGDDTESDSCEESEEEEKHLVKKPKALPFPKRVDKAIYLPHVGKYMDKDKVSRASEGSPSKSAKVKQKSKEYESDGSDHAFKDDADDSDDEFSSVRGMKRKMSSLFPRKKPSRTRMNQVAPVVNRDQHGGTSLKGSGEPKGFGGHVASNSKKQVADVDDEKSSTGGGGRGSECKPGSSGSSNERGSCSKGVSEANEKEVSGARIVDAAESKGKGGASFKSEAGSSKLQEAAGAPSTGGGSEGSRSSSGERQRGSSQSSASTGGDRNSGRGPSSSSGGSGGGLSFKVQSSGGGGQVTIDLDSEEEDEVEKPQRQQPGLDLEVIDLDDD